MDQLAAMKTFVRVSEGGSFSIAARDSATTQRAVSKQIAALEAHLGVKLLSRSTLALSLTAEGEMFFPEAQRLVRNTRRWRSGCVAGAHGIPAGCASPPRWDMVGSFSCRWC